MIDVGFNLFVRAMTKKRSIYEVDRLIADQIGDRKAYERLRGNSPTELAPLHEKISKLATAIGISYDRAVWDDDQTFLLICQLLDSCEDDAVDLDGTVFIDDEESCIANINVNVKTSTACRMTLVCKVVDLVYTSRRIESLAVHFWAGRHPLEFTMEPESLDDRRFFSALSNHEDYAILASGAGLFADGPAVLAQYLRDVWIEGTTPWRKSSDEESDGGIVYVEDGCRVPRMVTEYEATIDGDEYSIIFTAEEGKIWEIQSVWQGIIRFDVYWANVDDLLLQLVIQNGYAVYDFVKSAMRAAAENAICGRDSDSEDDTENESGAEDEFPKVKPEYDLTSYRSYKRPVEQVHIGDLVVRSSVRTCNNPEHDIREVIAIICVFSPGFGVTEVAVDAFCCPECKRYYILEKDFDRLKRKGSLCCRIIERSGSVSEFIPHNSLGLSEQSFYNSLGYNVGSDADLSPSERRAILDFAIANGFKTQKETINFLQWLIDFNGRRPNMSEAVAKWGSDIKYLVSNHSADVERVRIDRIFLSKHTHWE